MPGSVPVGMGCGSKAGAAAVGASAATLIPALELALRLWVQRGPPRGSAANPWRTLVMSQARFRGSGVSRLSRAPRIAMLPSSGAVYDDRAPWNAPRGVRTAETMQGVLGPNRTSVAICAGANANRIKKFL